MCYRLLHLKQYNIFIERFMHKTQCSELLSKTSSIHYASVRPYLKKSYATQTFNSG